MAKRKLPNPLKEAFLVELHNQINIKSAVTELFPFFSLFQKIFTNHTGVLLYPLWNSKIPPSTEQLRQLRKTLFQMLGDPCLQEKFAQSIVIFYEQLFSLKLGELLIDGTGEGLYCTIDLKSGRLYIGSSTDLNRRIGTHTSNCVNWCTHDNNPELASIMREAQDSPRFVTKSFFGKINRNYDDTNVTHRIYKEKATFLEETLAFCKTNQEKTWAVREWEICVIADLSKFSCLSFEGYIKSLCFNQAHANNSDIRKYNRNWDSPTQILNDILEKEETLSLPLYTVWLESVKLTTQQKKENQEAQARLIRNVRNEKSKQLRHKQKAQLLEIQLEIIKDNGLCLTEAQKKFWKEHKQLLAKRRAIYKKKKHILNFNCNSNVVSVHTESLLIEQGFIVTERVRENIGLVLSEGEKLLLQQCKKLKMDSRNKKSRDWSARKKALRLEAKMQKDNGLPLTDNQKDVLQKHLSANTKRRASLNNSNNKKRNLLTASSDVNTETVVIVVASCYRRLGEGKGKEKGLLVQQGNLLKKRLTQDPGTVFNQEEQLIWEDFCLLREKKNKSQQERRDVSAEARQSINSSRRQKEKDARESKKAEILCIQNKQHKGEALSDSEKSSLQAYTDLKKKRSENRKKKC